MYACQPFQAIKKLKEQVYVFYRTLCDYNSTALNQNIYTNAIKLVLVNSPAELDTGSSS